MKTLKPIVMPAMVAAACCILVLAPEAAAQGAETARSDRPASQPATPAPAKAPPLTMAFVDLEKIIEEHPDTKARSDEMKQRLQTSLEGLRQQAEKIRSEETALDVLTEGSPEFMDQLRKIRRQKAEIELDGKILRIEHQLQLVDALKQIYEKSKQVVAEVARDRGFNVVAMYSSSPVGGRTRNELITDIVTRPFIHIDPGLDITADVLARLKK